MEFVRSLFGFVRDKLFYFKKKMFMWWWEDTLTFTGQ